MTWSSTSTGALSCGTGQAGELVTESVPGEVDRERHALVLRLCYRLQWNPGEGTGEHWVDYPKTSVPGRRRSTTAHGARTACCCPSPPSRRAGR